MNKSKRQYAAQVFAFASFVESGTGIAVMIGPVLVVRLLLGEEVAGVGVAVARCFGVALFSLGLACWPTGAPVRSDSPGFRAMLVYNAVIALFLVYLAATGVSGTLLWPAIALHTAIGLSLLFARHGSHALQPSPDGDEL
ncbi:MAG: hypothetical protein WA900_01495 [Casimicrobiaceae bacterium]